MVHQLYSAMTANINNWTYKSKAELEALSDQDLNNVYQELTKAIKVFKSANTPMTDEMVWQLLVLPKIINDRKNLQIKTTS